MTVVVGFVGPDGAVMAADTEATEGGHSRFDVEKVWAEEGIILGYTGADSVRQPLAVSIGAAITAAFAAKAAVPRAEARDTLQAAIRPVLAQVYSQNVGHRTITGIPVTLQGRLLALGRDAEGYWLLEIDEHNDATFYEHQGFHAVGSGSSAAYVARSLMRDYHDLGRTPAQLKLMAYRTVQNCIDSLAGDARVGGEVRVWYSERCSTFVCAEANELESMANGVEQWRTVERESLRRVARDEDSPADTSGETLPEDLSDDP
jgi:hypothetical protein